MSRAMVRVMSRAGGWLAGYARRLAASLQGGGSAESRYRMIDGFLVQAKRFGRMRSAIITDLPSYLLYGGSGGTTSVRLEGDGISGRDVMLNLPDGQPPAFQPISGELDETRYFGYPTPNGLGWLFSPSPSYGAINQFGYLMSRTGLAPYYESSAAIKNPDDMSQLGLSTDVYAVTQMFSPYCLGLSEGISGGVVSIERRGLYLQTVNLRVDEGDLPSGWRFLPRRLVPHTSYLPSDPYSKLKYPGLSPTGGHYGDAQTVEMSGTDSLCVAARVFRQYPAMWMDYWPRFESDTPPSPEPARYTYYDREGEQGLAIIRGALDRQLYDPADGAQFLVAIGSIRIVLPTDLPMPELHPIPVLRLPSWGGRPPIPNYGMFLCPHVARAWGGFVTFSVYSTLRDTNLYPPGWAESDSDRPVFPHGYHDPDRSVIGQAYALVVSTDSTDIVLRADWDAADFALELSGGGAPTHTLPVPLLPTAEPDKLVLPWIVGATSAPADDTSFPRVDDAVCLVWEHHYIRRTWLLDLIGYEDIVRGIGGELVLYRSNGSSVARIVLGSIYAPLFAASMQGSPDTFGLNDYIEGRNSNLSHIQYAGAGKLVVAVVDSPLADPGVSHSVRCAIIDLASYSITAVGEIGERSSPDVRCYISVVQPFTEASGESPARPAVLLAGLYDPALPQDGGGQTFISHDGGVSWAELVEDRAGTNGVFFIGNTLWRFNNQGPLTLGEKR